MSLIGFNECSLIGKNLLRAPSMRRSVQHISSRVYEVLSKQPTLAQTRSAVVPMAVDIQLTSSAGQIINAWLMTQRRQTAISPATWMGVGNEAFEFFDLLQTT